MQADKKFYRGMGDFWLVCLGVLGI